MGLVLGKSSSALKGLNIVPGVIDPDFIGEIKILACSPKGVAIIAQGDHIDNCWSYPAAMINIHQRILLGEITD